MNAPCRPLMAGLAHGADPAAYSVSVARTLNDLMQVMAVRSVVYLSDQSCPYTEEFDGNDFAGATHLVLRYRDEPVGVARLRWFADFAKLERLAIRREHRGLSSLLMLARCAIQLAERKGYSRMMGHANGRIVHFWCRHFGGKPRLARPAIKFSDHDYIEMELELHPPADALSIDSDPMVLLRPEGDWDRPGVLDRSLQRASVELELTGVSA